MNSIDAYYSKNKKYQRLKILKKYKNFKFIKIDLINFEKLSNILKKQKINKIIHLAAQPGVRVSISKPHNTMKKNLTVFLNIIEFARIKKVKKFIYASSSSVYGDSKIYPFNENDFKNTPVSVYGATKLSNEIIANANSKYFKMDILG